MQATHPPLVRTRLSAMMFLEFFIWGGWYIAISGYANATLHFTGPQIGWLMATTALGAIIAPMFVGYVADRLFATERILAVMHFLGGVCLILSAQQKSFGPLLALLMLNGLCFMPTMALANSLAFRHIPDPSRFPRIALLGTIGWIVSNLIVAVALGGATTEKFFYVSGIGGIVMGVYCLTLPHTPPKGAAGGDVLGLGALKLLKEPSFLVFTLSAFAISLPAYVFFVATVPMLQERGYPSPLALMTLNQFSEIIFMFTMPIIVIWLGLKRVLVIGMLAWGLRYLCFAAGGFPLAIVGLLLHGFCYSFVFVGAYMFVDRRAPAEIKASAQSLIAFLMLGVGSFVGCKMGGALLDSFPAQLTTMPAVAAAGTADKAAQPAKPAEAPLPRWDDPNAAASAWRYLDLSSTLNRLMTGKEAPPEPDLGQKLDADRDGAITLSELEKVPDAGLQLGGQVYARDDLVATFKKVAALGQPSAAAGELRVTRQQWLAAQSHDWQRFWLWPSAAAFMICAFFALAYRDKPSAAA